MTSQLSPDLVEILTDELKAIAFNTLVFLRKSALWQYSPPIAWNDHSKPLPSTRKEQVESYVNPRNDIPKMFQKWFPKCVF